MPNGMWKTVRGRKSGSLHSDEGRVHFFSGKAILREDLGEMGSSNIYMNIRKKSKKDKYLPGKLSG